MSSSPRVAVVGGGLAGLTVARQLNIKSPARSIDVEVFESSSRVGGVIETSTSDGYLREHAANAALGAERGGAADLANDLGLEMIAASPLAKKRWIYTGGALCEVPSHPVDLARSKLLSARAKLRLLSEPVRGGLSGEPTVEQFFRHRLGDEVHDRVVAPFVNGIYAGDTSELSMPASFPRVTALAAKGGLFRGMIGSMRSKGRSKDARVSSAPAGGMGAIISKLGEKLTGRLRLEEPVASIQRSSRGVDITTESGRLEHFDAVVCAVPSHRAATMFKGADAELAELLAMIPFAGVAVVHLGYPRKAVGHPLNGFGFLAAPNEDLELLGVVFESSIWQGRAPAGSVLLRCMIGGRTGPDISALDDDALLAMAKRNAAKVLEVTGEPEHANVVRWPRAIAQYTIGHRDRLERSETLAAEQGVVLAGASYHGVAVNSVTGDAVRAARRVHELLAAPLMLALVVMLSSLLACSGAGKTKAQTGGGDGGEDAQPQVIDDDGGPVESAPSTAFASNYEVLADTSDVTKVGTIGIEVIAPNPAAKLVAPKASAKSCKTRGRRPLVVHTLGGVSGAVVWLEDITKGRAETTPRGSSRVTFRDCALSPRVTVVGRLDSALDVVTASERAVALEVTHATGAGASSPNSKASAITTLLMDPIGRGFSVPVRAQGIYRISGVASEGIEDAWTVVAGTPYIEKTGEKGRARLTGVPAGNYTLRIWHPPINGVELSKSVAITVEAGKEAIAKVDLSAELSAIK